MNTKENAIAVAQNERHRLCEECFQLLYKISKKPSCLKLLGLAKEHLALLASYKSGRQQTKPRR